MRYEIKIKIGQRDNKLDVLPLIVESANGWFVAAERIPFWTTLKVGDVLSAVRHVSMTYGNCILLDRVNDRVIRSRTILIHNGSGYMHSTNCLIPVPEGASLKSRWMTTGPASRKEVLRWREKAPFELVVKEISSYFGSQS